ncbi:MAG: outer membrane beta-barrel protein [Phaeodactylibacter sp.]|nr:outer membrane beta-barrel protein [Phaeodactylibacter sp.]
MKNTLLLSLLFLLFHSPGLSQEEAGWPWYMQANAHLHGGFPIEGYADKQEKDGLGWGAQLLFQAKRGRPLFVGLEGSMLYLDKERLRFTAIENGQEIDYRLVTNNNIFMAHGLLRFKPFVNSWVQPYADGLVGLKKLYTRTRLIDESLEDEEVVEAETDLSNTAFSYGLGAGLQVYLSDFPTVLGDIRVVYLPGENATYYTRRDEAPDPLEDPLDAFERVSSPTALLLIQLGVTIQLSDSDFQEAAAPNDDF